MRLPDRKGYFGIFGGRFVPETLIQPLIELERVYIKLKKDRSFKKELNTYLRDFAGRPTPLYFAKNLTEKLKGPKIYLKREDLTHTGAHKINNTLGQCLLAKKMGKQRIVAETGAGQHGVASATSASLLGLKCTIYMGEEDSRRQSLNVMRMRLLSAEVISVSSGSKTLKDAINEAIRDWVTNIDNTHYLIGSVVGPHPYPMIVRDFQSVIGKEVKRQILLKEGRLPDIIIACVGGGSNAIGIFHPFFKDNVRFIGVEAGGKGLSPQNHGASLNFGSLGILHGSMSYILQDTYGNISGTHSLAPGLDYPGVGPEHSYYKEIKRAEYVTVSDEEALDAFYTLSRTEGIMPALESAHAIAYLKKIAPKMEKNQIIIVNLSGRGDKDISYISEKVGEANG